MFSDNEFTTFLTSINLIKHLLPHPPPHPSTEQGAPHKCALIFVDNSGVDIVLGILPFARQLLQRGTKVILCANRSPALNDITCGELRVLLDKCRTVCPLLGAALDERRLLVADNGQSGPCLDMRHLSDGKNAHRKNPIKFEMF